MVLKLGNEIELTEVDLTGILPSATIMVVTVTASTTIGTPLPEDALAAVIESCEQVAHALRHDEQQMPLLTCTIFLTLITLRALLYWRSLRYNTVAHALGEQAEAAVTSRCYLYLPLHTLHARRC